MYRLHGPLAVLTAGCFVDPGSGVTAASESQTDAAESNTADPGPTTGAAPGSCGDGVQDDDEQCDNGPENGVDGSFCREDCTTNLCGDGYQASTEQCDDGNLEPGDGCGASCRLETCGDGLPGPNEACDDGNLDDLDDCSNSCAVAACGDGKLQADREQCDDGNLEPADGCGADCQVQLCGDGQVDVGEDCDDGDLVDGDGCGATCQRDARFVFATSALYPGSFGGLAEADMLCQELAAAATLPGQYMAWLTTGKEGPLARFTRSSLPYVLVDGTAIAGDWLDLIDGVLLHPIDHDETGAAIPVVPTCMPASLAWTNTRPDATPVSTETECFEWSFPIGEGRAGRLAAQDGEWSNGCNVECQSALHLYCFEQGA